jgi:hypothetical protein
LSLYDTAHQLRVRIGCYLRRTGCRTLETAKKPAAIIKIDEISNIGAARHCKMMMKSQFNSILPPQIILRSAIISIWVRGLYTSVVSVLHPIMITF